MPFRKLYRPFGKFERSTFGEFDRPLGNFKANFLSIFRVVQSCAMNAKSRRTLTFPRSMVT